MKPKLKPPGNKRLKLKCDLLLSTSAFKFNLRRYRVLHEQQMGRGLPSSTFRLVIAFCVMRGAFRGCLEGVRGYRGVFRVYFVSETA